MSRLRPASADLELLEERLELAAYGRRRGGPGIAILAIRIDPKRGHPAPGPEAVAELGDRIYQRLAGCLRRADTLVHLGAMQYVALLERLEEGAFATRAGEAVVNAIRSPFVLDGARAEVVASVGISVFPNDGERLEELLQCAEAAAQAAKLSGGDLFGFYSGSLSEAAARRMSLERALAEAVERGQLRLHYQPQLDTRDGTLVGVEALLRWEHPSLGPVSPEEFVPVLESLGLMDQAGAWVLHEACRQVVQWSDEQSKMRVGVNASASQLRRRGFESQVRQALQESGLDPRRLELELTETVLLEDELHVREMLHSLRRDGVRVALDDFGTGYASLAYIRQFPMDTLKIDRQFVRGLPVDAQNAAITGAIVALGRSLQLEVVAEGVEHEAEEEFLHSLQCHVVQGFRYARPMSPEQFAQWRKARPWV